MCDQQRLRSACAYAQSDQSLCSSLDYYMNVKLPTKGHLEYQSLKVEYTCSSESTLVKVPHHWKSHVTAHINDIVIVFQSDLTKTIEALELIAARTRQPPEG